MKTIIRTATIQDIPVISDIAHRTWPVSYKDMIRAAQIVYMLDRMYSHKALQEQMEVKHHPFFIANFNGEDIGYASFSKQDTQRFRLEKLYVLPAIQGSGAGKALLNHIENTVREQGAAVLELTVNRKNKSKHFYERMGFAVVSEIVMGIGGGFVMDDYIMEKQVGSC
ncbi:MAG: GNAT family N-acetyltransferase [Flavobacteriales bacterium]|nr:GNAT family N-acetyltransferase [Flavobacteriales bacterium]